MVFNYDINLYL